MPTMAWTEVWARFCLAAVLLVATGVLAGLEHGPVRAVLGLTAVAIAVLAVRFDAAVGIVIGLVAAAITIAVKRSTGVWETPEFPLAATEAITLVGLAWVMGLLGTGVRRVLLTTGATAPGTLVPAGNSLGLLDAKHATSRLDEEIGRLRHSGQPVGLLLISADAYGDELDDVTRLRALRAVSRTLESQTRDTDVPFALTDTVIGAILPATDTTDGWSLLGRLIPAASSATFTDRTSNARRQVSDSVDLRACLTYAEDGQDAAKLIAAGLDRLDPAHDGRRPLA